VSVFNEAVPPIAIDGIFGASTEAALEDFQRAYGLPVTGEADLITWRTLYNAYRGYLLSLPRGYFGETTLIYPGTPLLEGSRGEDVRALQEYLAAISEVYTEIPSVVPDGVFGAVTEEAVRIYQSLFGIEPTGIVASTTWNSITDTYRTVTEGQFGGERQFGGTMTR